MLPVPLCNYSCSPIRLQNVTTCHVTAHRMQSLVTVRPSLGVPAYAMHVEVSQFEIESAVTKATKDQSVKVRELITIGFLAVVVEAIVVFHKWTTCWDELLHRLCLSEDLRVASPQARRKVAYVATHNVAIPGYTCACVYAHWSQYNAIITFHSLLIAFWSVRPVAYANTTWLFRRCKKAGHVWLPRVWNNGIYVSLFHTWGSQLLSSISC